MCAEVRQSLFASSLSQFLEMPFGIAVLRLLGKNQTLLRQFAGRSPLAGSKQSFNARCHAFQVWHWQFSNGLKPGNGIIRSVQFKKGLRHAGQKLAGSAVFGTGFVSMALFKRIECFLMLALSHMVTGKMQVSHRMTWGICSAYQRFGPTDHKSIVT
jgi:hypothetical protein